jgi:hypothetical protein
MQSEGARWMPWFKTIFDEGRDVTTLPGTELVLYLASGMADALSGRYFAAPDDPADVVAHTEEILAKELHLLRVRFRDPD